LSRRSPLVPWQAKFAALALIWGASFLLIKIGLSVLAPVQVATLRILTGTATVLVLAAMTGTRLPRDPRVWKHLAVTGFLLCALPFTLFPLGEERVSSALAGIGNATTPMAAVLFTLLMIPADRLPARKIGAVAVGFVGVVVITQPWQSAGRPDVLGFTMTLVAGASYGLGWTYLRRFLRGEDLGGLSLPAGQLVMASAQMLVIVALWWLFLRSTVPAPWSTHAPADGSVLPGVLSVLVLGAVGTGLAFALQFDVVRAVGAQVGTTVTYVIPVVAVLLGVLLLHERLEGPQVLGAAIVLAAAVVTGLPDRRPAAEPTGIPAGSGERV